MVKSIQNLRPDYILSVSYTVNKSGVHKNDVQKSLKHLIETLHSKGFSTQVRSGEAGSLMLFIKLLSYKYIEEAEKDLIKNYLFGITCKNNTNADRLRIIYQYLTHPKNVGGIGITPLEGEWEFIKSITPVTDVFNDSSIAENFQNHLISSKLSTGLIKEIYGIKIALYFEYLKFYTMWLIPLSIFGMFLNFKSKKKYLLIYTFINLIWSCLFIVFWNKKQEYLVNFWGVQNINLVYEHCSELSEINDKFKEKSSYKHKDNGELKRFIKSLSYFPIVLIFGIILIFYQLSCFLLEIFLTEIYDGPGKLFLNLLPAVLLTIFIPTLTVIYDLVIRKLSSWEGHATSYSQNNSILIKRFTIDFLISYAPLIITSFIYLPFAHLIESYLGIVENSTPKLIKEYCCTHKYLTKLRKQEDFIINQDKLTNQYFYFIVTDQIIRLIFKYVLPLVLQIISSKFIKLTKFIFQKNSIDKRVNDLKSEKPWLDSVRHSVRLPTYDVNNDFKYLIIQYGYLIIFGPIWSFAPLICIVFNLITFKLDMLKLANGKYFNPPIPERVNSIYPWNYFLFILTWISSIVSPIIITFYHNDTRPPKPLGQLSLDKASVNVSFTPALILLLFCSEHLFLIFYMVLSNLLKLLKSNIEWENNLIDDNIKLRHDYYSSNVQITISAPDDSDWSKFKVDDTLSNANSIMKNNIKDLSHNDTNVSDQAKYPKNKTKDIDTEIIPIVSKNYLTSVEKSSTSSAMETLYINQKKILEEKSELLNKKKAELKRIGNPKGENILGSEEALEKIKEKDDCTQTDATF